MRYSPAAFALSLTLALTASVGLSAPPRSMDPRAVTLLTQGRAEQEAGRTDAAIDMFEAALTVQPGSADVLLALAESTRQQGMQGKALHYYREVLNLEPQNLSAIAGEGAALVEKGAVEKARRNLTRLQGLCGAQCDPTRQLAAAIAKGPPPKVVTAEAVKPSTVVTEN